MERGMGHGQGNTGTPAANTASRKKENTPGSQRGRRGEERASRGNASQRRSEQKHSTESVRLAKRPAYGLPS
jgi:hypothetical protein